jgi:hypothetical protein
MTWDARHRCVLRWPLDRETSNFLGSISSATIGRRNRGGRPSLPKKRGSGPDRTHRRRLRATAQAKVHIHRPTTQFLVISTSPFAVLSWSSILVSGRPTSACQYTWQRRDRSFGAPSSPLRPRQESPLVFWHWGHSSTRLSTNHAFSAPSNLCPSASSQLWISIDQRQPALKPSSVVAWAAKGDVLEWATSDARDSRWTALDRCRALAWGHCLVPSGKPALSRSPV